MNFAVFVAIDIVAMEVITLTLGKRFDFPTWKRALLPLLFGITGVAGVKLLYFIENGKWNGLSYFGIIFFSPILLIALAPLLKIKTGDMLDIAAPCECITLAIQKVDCYLTGCCKGMILEVRPSGEYVRFPSQIVECINGLILTAVLIYIIVKAKRRGRVFFIYMVIYGITRYCLNLLRDAEPVLWFLPEGNILSIFSFVIGTAVLLILKKKRQKSGAATGNLPKSGAPAGGHSQSVAPAERLPKSGAPAGGPKT